MARVLEDGTEIALYPQFYTCALVVDLDRIGNYKRRFCYEDAMECLLALVTWDGQGDPPGPWIKEKPGDRLGPGAFSPANSGSEKETT